MVNVNQTLFYKMLTKTLLILLFSFNLNLVVFAEKSYVIEQTTHLFGHQCLYLTPTKFKLINKNQNIEIYCSAPDYRVYFINTKKHTYFIDNIDNIKDPKGSGFIVIIISGAKKMKLANYWQKKANYKNAIYDGTIYKFKYPSKFSLNSDIFHNLIIANLKNVNPNFIKLHSKLNGLPVMPNIVYELDFYNDRCRLDDLILTNSSKIIDTSIIMPNLSKYKLAKTYDNFLEISSNKEALDNFFDFTR